MHVGGPHAGTWHDFENDESGGVLDLVEKERRCDRAGAIRWLESEKLIPAQADRRYPSSNLGKAAQAPPERRSTAPTSTPARTDENRQATVYAGKLWAEAVPADDGPGRIYLANRWVWPAVHVDETPPLPAEVVRWLSRKDAFHIRDPRTGKGLWLPETAAGALVFAITDAAESVCGAAGSADRGR